MKGDRLMRIGMWVTVIGMIFTLIAILPLFIDGLTLPSFMWFLAMLTGVGMAMILLGLRRSSKVRSSLK